MTKCNSYSRRSTAAMITIAILLLCLASCSQSYGDLEKHFREPTKGERDGYLSDEIALFSKKPSFMGSGDHVRGRFLSGKVILEPQGIDRFFLRAVEIPAMDIVGCRVINFGPGGTSIIFPVRGTGSSFMVSKSDGLMNWCTENKLPLLSRAEYEAWESLAIPAKE